MAVTDRTSLRHIHSAATTVACISIAPGVDTLTLLLLLLLLLGRQLCSVARSLGPISITGCRCCCCRCCVR
jgi:hypothetical protein